MKLVNRRMSRSLINRKIKSFTLVEISVTILLSLIVVSMMYMALNIVARQVEQPKATTSENITLLNLAVSNAFFDATVIRWAEESQTISCIDSVQHRQVEFAPEAIIMMAENTSLTDTIWEGAYNFDVELNESNLVNSLYINIPFQGDSLQLYIPKQYSLSTLLNHKEISFEY